MSNSRSESIGYKLKTIRIRKGWSQSFVSRQVGISIRSISRLETGRTASKNLIKKLCTLYQIPSYSLYEEKPLQGKEAVTVDLIPEDVMVKLVLGNSLVNDIQREAVLRFNDFIQKNALMLREDVEEVLPDVISNKKSYTLADVVSCCMAVNQRTIVNIGNLVMM